MYFAAFIGTLQHYKLQIFALHTKNKRTSKELHHQQARSAFTFKFIFDKELPGFDFKGNPSPIATG